MTFLHFTKQNFRKHQYKKDTILPITVTWTQGQREFWKTKPLGGIIPFSHWPEKPFPFITTIPIHAKVDTSPKREMKISFCDRVNPFMF